MPPPAPPSTMGRLAASLGVSKTTIHRALTGAPRISPETRQRVLAAARAAGYHRDPFFSALSSLRKKQVGRTTLPIHYLRGSPINPEFTRGIDMFPALQSAGRDFGFDVNRVNLSDYPKFKTLPRILYQRGCRGLVLEQVDPVLHETLLGFKKVPVVCCQRQEGLPFHTVRFGAADRVRLCWRKLREAGYRRIGCAVVLHDPPNRDDQDRLGAAFVLAQGLEEKDRVPPLATVMRGSLNPETYVAWLDRHRPDAVITSSIGASLLHRSLPFPPPVLACLHASADSRFPRIPGASGSLEQLAVEALHVLDRLIRHGETGLPANPVDIVIPPLWHEGDGIPSAPRASRKRTRVPGKV